MWVLVQFWFNSVFAGTVLFWFTHNVDHLMSLCGFCFSSGSVLALAGSVLVLFWFTCSVVVQFWLLLVLFKFCIGS